VSVKDIELVRGCGVRHTTRAATREVEGELNLVDFVGPGWVAAAVVRAAKAHTTAAEVSELREVVGRCGVEVDGACTPGLGSRVEVRRPEGYGGRAWRNQHVSRHDVSIGNVVSVAVIAGCATWVRKPVLFLEHVDAVRVRGSARDHGGARRVIRQTIRADLRKQHIEWLLIVRLGASDRFGHRESAISGRNGCASLGGRLLSCTWHSDREHRCEQRHKCKLAQVGLPSLPEPTPTCCCRPSARCCLGLRLRPPIRMSLSVCLCLEAQ